MNRAVLLMASILLFLASPLSAQELLVKVFEAGDLSQDQAAALQLLRSLPTTGELEIVQVNTTALRTADVVQISLPGRAAVEVAADVRTFRDGEDFLYAGVTELLDALAIGKGPVGQSTFVVNGDAVTGSIQTETGLYRIRPLGGVAHALFKAGQFPSEHPESFDQGGDTKDLPPIQLTPETDTSIADLRILVLYTPGVKSQVTDIDGLVQLAFAETNASYSNSGVYINAVPASASPLAVEYSETGSFDTDISALASKADGQIDDVHSLRDQADADVVVMLVANRSYCGLASSILASKDTAFALVYHDCATGYYSFAHEIGHLQGARHNPEADPSSSPFKYGHGYMDTANKRRTIMSYDCPGGCTRLPQWARPTEWGTVDLNHDARALNETRTHISGFE